MLHELIAANYDLEVESMELFTQHFGTEIFSVHTNKGKFIVKTLPSNDPNDNGMENEGHITEYVQNNGFSVARLLKTNSGKYHVRTENLQFHVQEFIEGDVIAINAAPEWFMEKSACLLGKIHHALKEYDEMPIQFGKDFFHKSNVLGVKSHYEKRLDEAAKQENAPLRHLLKKRVQHLERISSFDIDTDKLTYSNAHGDFRLGNIILNKKDITVIDWTCACRMPICYEIMRSYVFADPKCADGRIDSDRLKQYITHYSQYFRLGEHDIKTMPYLFYYQQMICNYPPNQDVPDTYISIRDLIIKVTDWLYENVEILGKELIN